MMTFRYCCAVATAAAVSSAVCVPKRLQKKERENVIKYAEQKKIKTSVLSLCEHKITP